MTWPKVALSQIFDIARGGSPRPIDAYITDDPDGINWVMISDASASSKFITGTKKRIRKEGVQRSRAVNPGDFVLTNSMSFGRPYIMQTSGCIHDGWLVLAKKENNVDSDFFYHLLGSQAVYGEFERLAAGATVKNLNIDLVKKVRIPLPPLEEQRRIAAILDKADELRQRRRVAIQKLDSLTQSLFLDAFKSRKATQQKWPSQAISLLGRITTGRTPPSELDGMFGGELPFVTPGDLEGIWNHRVAKRTLTRDGASMSKVVRAGSTAVCCIGATIGKMGLIATDFAFNQQINAVEWDGKIDDIYGYFALTQLKDEISLRGASTTLPILKKTEFEKLVIPVPPLDTQKRFRAQIESVMRLHSRLSESGEQSDSLFSALQSQAFMGEL